MKIKNEKIGIWGYGRVGKAAAQLLLKHDARIVVYDSNALALAQCSFKTTQSIEDFFAQTDIILPSPGIDINPYIATYPGKWISELDLFQSFFTKKTIAITGSVGKTSVTHLLTQALKDAGWRVQAGGNIGTPMLSLIETQNDLDAEELELSSYQLEHTQSFAPDLAIWTNLYPNHLDRHTTIEQYFLAKYQILRYQTPKKIALAPLDLEPLIKKKSPQSSLRFFDPSKRPLHHPSGFAVNWIIVETALSLLNETPTKIRPPFLEHRLETVATVKGATFINDSKSTTPASTLAALNCFKSSKILLLLGGLSKGVDRTDLIKSLSKNITTVCFGSESKTLFNICKKHSINASCHASTQLAIEYSLTHAHMYDIILFSPSGSSFDEFANYEKRGNLFKKMILSHKN